MIQMSVPVSNGEGMLDGFIFLIHAQGLVQNQQRKTNIIQHTRSTHFSLCNASP